MMEAAMPSSNPISMTFPPFSGATRRLVLWNLGIFFALAVTGLLAGRLTDLLVAHLLLQPIALLRGELWQLVTYAFLNFGILNTAFALLTLWFIGSMLESARGSRWLYELYFTSLIGGALIASALSFTRVLHLSPLLATGGPYAAIFGLLIAIAMLFGEQEFLLFFFIRIKAKYMVAIYILIDLAILLKSADNFQALVHLSGALAGFLYLRLVPRRGLASGVSERFYALRNEYYRAKRRRAARKFEVYMGKQGRKVQFDKDGRYVDPDAKRDPTDKRWMN
jgi:membrane associated rhomboid family serine protease